ncbi:MAG: DUF1553 domain-containing protein [Planctomycetota bacterium]|nr:MAG: DUF1553 domain-containing protein [Planctomycetota bacterium]
MRQSLIGLIVFSFLPLIASAEDDTAPAEPPVTESDRDFWSFRPLERPALPNVENSDWCRTPIDRFILARLESDGLQPAPEADRHALLRRVTFDLTGLPPSPAEIASFEADRRPGAYERVVDRLLSSRAYGERSAQHWLDLARYADTDGFEHDLVRPNAWRYRDWVIDAFSDDMPYDEFVRLQLAGDEINPESTAAHVATGFLMCGPDMPDINLQEERRHTVLNGVTATIGSVFLGLQLECAACHHHKYDPVSQHDFYRLRAFFDSTDLLNEHPLPSRDAEAAKAAFQANQRAEWNRLEAELAAARNDRPADESRIAKLEAELQAVKTAKPPPVPMGRVARNRSDSDAGSYLWLRGDFRRRGPAVEPAFLRVVYEDADSAPEQPARLRRSDLADWLTQPEHPLVTRVIVNRVWQQHFGRGLCATASDFGFMGEWPTHPELLDWLARELPRQGWSLKKLHRLVVTSTAYRTASYRGPEWNRRQRDAWQDLLSADTDNDLFGRMSRRRLDAEAIRDAMLSASGTLCRQAGGPGIRPPLPNEVVGTLLKNQWPVTENETDHHRRSIYLFVRRNLTYPMFDVFDRPDTNRSCPRRGETTTAPQALHLLNSGFSRRCADELADQLRTASDGEPAAQVELLYRRVLGRSPDSAELQRAVEFLNQGSESETALSDLCLALFNLNEFLYLD